MLTKLRIQSNDDHIIMTENLINFPTILYHVYITNTRAGTEFIHVCIE
ncbi:MAG: hypothetical protein ACI90V_009049 [Bacillariaceae sp.]|jgi:hypothetical protein